MTRLLAIRDLNQGDPLPGLGPKVEPERKPAPAERPQPLPHNPEVLRRPDGKLETDISKNKGVAWQRRDLCDEDDLSWMLWRDKTLERKQARIIQDFFQQAWVQDRAEKLAEETSGTTPYMRGADLTDLERRVMAYNKADVEKMLDAFKANTHVDCLDAASLRGTTTGRCSSQRGTLIHQKIERDLSAKRMHEALYGAEFKVGDPVKVLCPAFLGKRGQVARVLNASAIIDTDRGTMVFYKKDLQHDPRP